MYIQLHEQIFQLNHQIGKFCIRKINSWWQLKPIQDVYLAKAAKMHSKNKTSFLTIIIWFYIYNSSFVPLWYSYLA